MLNKRLVRAVPESRKYIAGNVLCQWVSLLANIAMMASIAQLLAGLLFVACVIVWFVIHSKIKAAHDDNYLKCYAHTEQFEKDEADYAALQALKADKEKWKAEKARRRAEKKAAKAGKQEEKPVEEGPPAEAAETPATAEEKAETPAEEKQQAPEEKA